VVLPSINGLWYTSQSRRRPERTATRRPVRVGDPVRSDIRVLRWVQWSVELMASTGGMTVFMCIYDDRRYLGYPQ
jgi:hypothetical protein